MGVSCGFAPVFCAPAQAQTGAPPPAEPFLYVPPGLRPNVVFYHSFSQGPDRPEVNLLAAGVAPGKARLAPGLTDDGLIAQGGGRCLGLAKLSWPLTRPVTIGMWWRLEAPMRDDTGFHLVGLRGPRGYISNFVAGKGPWCALTRPTFVMQVYNFPGISNVNGIWFGDAWMDANAWHHAAVTVSEGSRVCVYWDGKSRSDVTVAGRLFRADDVVLSMDFGSSSATHPMTIDEVLVLDRALSGEQVRSYITAVRRLAEIGFPFQQPPWP